VSPEIHSERLILRERRLDDFADAFARWSDPEFTRFSGGARSSAAVALVFERGAI
jgi:RimJ/RimL family protein N-acetyltransferase